MRISTFRRLKPAGVIISLVILSSLLIAACGGSSPSILDTHGDAANTEQGLFWFILVVATIIFVGVEGLLIFAIVRYRERPNSPNPRQTHGNNTLEIIWTVIPSVFLFLVLGFTLYTMYNLSVQASNPTLKVRAFGHQWWWEFDYNVSPNYHFVTADELHIPVNTKVEIDLFSDNVIHSFWIPQLSGKTDDIPGHNNHVSFKALDTGTYLGECAEYCGNQHAHMNFKVIVDSQSTFTAWTSMQQKFAQDPAGTTAACNPASGTPVPDVNLALCGEQIFAQQCTVCHGIVDPNVSSDVQANNTPTSIRFLSTFDDPNGALKRGPNLTHFGSRHLIAGDVLQWDPSTCVVANDTVAHKDNCMLYRWLQNPQSVKPCNDMILGQEKICDEAVNSGLSPLQITELIAYLESLA